MARSKAKSRKSKSSEAGVNGSGSGNNSGGENSDSGNSNSTGNGSSGEGSRGGGGAPFRANDGPSTSRAGFGASVRLERAEDIREAENRRPMSEEEVLAQQLKHLQPYRPDAEPDSLVKNAEENARVRIEFPKRNSDYNPYARWDDFSRQQAPAEEDQGDEGGSSRSTTSSSSSSTYPSRGRGRGRKGGGVGGNAPRMTPLQGSQGRLSYTLLGVAKENPINRERQMIYGVAFNQWVGRSADVFATVGDHSVTIYQVRSASISKTPNSFSSLPSSHCSATATCRAASAASPPTTPRARSSTAATGAGRASRTPASSSLPATAATFA